MFCILSQAARQYYTQTSVHWSHSQPQLLVNGTYVCSLIPTWQISTGRAWLRAQVVVLAAVAAGGGSCDGDTGADTPVSADTDHRPDTND